MTKLNFVSCHRMPERSFFYKGKQFPVCARCTGIYLGYFIFMPTMIYINISILVAIICVLPTILDGLTQAFCSRESNNTLRFLSGVLAGFGVSGITNHIAAFIAELIKNLIN